MRTWEELNLQPPGFGPGALPIELHVRMAGLYPENIALGNDYALSGILLLC